MGLRAIVVFCSLAVLSAGAAMLITPAAAVDVCSTHARDAGWRAPAVTDRDGKPLDLDALLVELSSTRAVFIGERHDALFHHLNQLEMVCRLHQQSRARGLRLAIGMEFFQTPFQPALDAYIDGHGDLDRLLADSEYFTRWGYDFRLYAPILRFARTHRLKLVALNAPAEQTRRVASDGPAALDPSPRKRVERALAEVSESYRERLRKVFEKHPGHDERSFSNFLAAQLLWDETMAGRAADFLRNHPRHRLVVLAGGGHVDHADAVPGRLRRDLEVETAMLIQTRSISAPPPHRSFVLSGDEIELPVPGRLGVALRVDDGAVVVDGFADVSAARDAGIVIGDRLLRINDQIIDGMGAVRRSLWQGRPGDLVDVSVASGDDRYDLRLALR